MEKWVDIKDYEDYYQISNCGNIRSKDRYVNCKGNKKALKRGGDRKAGITNGYKVFILSKNNTGKGVAVHRLVALHFVPNPENKPEVNHKDRNKLNNNDWNLEWCTRSENQQHAYNNGVQSGIIGSKHHASKINEIDVVNMFRLYFNGKTKHEISLLYPISYSSVCRILKNKTWKHVGLIEFGLAIEINTLKDE